MDFDFDFGELETDATLPDLLVALYQGRFTGSLRLSRDEELTRIRFERGLPTWVDCEPELTSLGEALAQAGRFSQPEFESLSSYMRLRHCREEVALIRLQMLSPKELLVALRDRSRQRILACFGWTSGDYELEGTVRTAPEHKSPALDPLPLVIDGMRKEWGSERIHAALKEHLDRYPVPTPTGTEFLQKRADDDPLRLFAEAVDGTRSLASLTQESGTAGALASAWLLQALGWVRFRPTPVIDLHADPTANLEFEITVADGSDANAQAPREKAAADDPTPNRAAALDALGQEILERHAQSADANHYQVLGIASDADMRSVKLAYIQLAKRFHPDALATVEQPEIRQAANQLFARIAKAHNTLSNAARRKEYDAALGGSSAEDADRLGQAELAYRKAEILIRAGNFNGAEELLRPAVELWPDESAYWAALGWVLYKKSPPDLDQARVHLEHALELDPENAEAREHLDRVRASR